MSNNIDRQYKELVEYILRFGNDKKDRTGTGTKSVFGWQIRHNMREGFPLLTTKKMYFKGIVTELLWFLRGETNIKYLLENDCDIWTGDAYKRYLDSSKFSSNPYDFKIKSSEQLEVDGNKIEGWGDFKIDGFFNKKEFVEQIKTDDRFANKWGELGPIYGKQWRQWETYDFSMDNDFGNNEFGGGWNVKQIDQISNIINELKRNPDSRRMMVSAWNVAELNEMTLPPCHYGFQVYTRELNWEERVEIARKTLTEEKFNEYGYISPFTTPMITFWLNQYNIPKRAISLMWNQRSVDTFLGLPFNIASYALLLELFGEIVNMVPEDLIGNLGDTHLYNNHIEQAKEQLTRDAFELPKLIINGEFWLPATDDGCGMGAGTYGDFSGLARGFEISDFRVENYKSHPAIKAPLSN